MDVKETVIIHCPKCDDIIEAPKTQADFAQVFYITEHCGMQLSLVAELLGEQHATS